MHARNKARARAEREANKASLRERESQGRRWAAEAAQALAAELQRRKELQAASSASTAEPR